MKNQTLKMKKNKQQTPLEKDQVLLLDKNISVHSKRIGKNELSLSVFEKGQLLTQINTDNKGRDDIDFIKDLVLTHKAEQGANYEFDLPFVGQENINIDFDIIKDL